VTDATPATKPPAARLQARRIGLILGRKTKPVEPLKAWCMYVLRCGDGSLYCGITNDLTRRLQQHRQGSGARYTRGRGPLVVLHTWPMDNKSIALKAELSFKSKSRQAKEQLLASLS
jgi:putative endonuclease